MTVYLLRSGPESQAVLSYTCIRLMLEQMSESSLKLKGGSQPNPGSGNAKPKIHQCAECAHVHCRIHKRLQISQAEVSNQGRVPKSRPKALSKDCDSIGGLIRGRQGRGGDGKSDGNG
jgi:hypothetical protein